MSEVETFTKLFSSLITSSIWSEDNETRLVWITMLAMADQTGYVGASVPGLAHAARVSIEAVEIALAKFKAPDPHSRSKNDDGRRIVEADRGWVLINLRRKRDARERENRLRLERERKAEAKRAENVGPSVYLMRRANDGALRIGFHSNPIDRRRTLESELGVNVELIGFRPATKQEVRGLVDQFAARRVGKSDWLAFSDEIEPAVLGELGCPAIPVPDPVPTPLHRSTSNPPQSANTDAESDPEADPKTEDVDPTEGGTGETVAPPERTTVRRIRASKPKPPPEKPVAMTSGWRPPAGAWEHAKAQFEATDEQLERATRDVVFYWTGQGTRRGPRGWVRTWQNRIAKMASSGDLYFERSAALHRGPARGPAPVQRGGYSAAERVERERNVK